MKVWELIKELEKYNPSLKIQLESHCGQMGDCSGVLIMGDVIALCNVDGYAKEEYAKKLSKTNLNKKERKELEILRTQTKEKAKVVLQEKTKEKAIRGQKAEIKATQSQQKLEELGK
ncbi:MAG: hypothetical protein JSW07_00305 [bacterium]|nr:MAG: hypothetical protein JSW07_00305 [bacterium]